MNVFVYEPSTSVMPEPTGTKHDTLGAIDMLKHIRDIAHDMDTMIHVVTDAGTYSIIKHTTDKEIESVAAEIAAVYAGWRKNRPRPGAGDDV